MTETTIAAVPVKAGTPNLNKALSQLQGELPKVTKGNEGKITYEGKDGREGGSYKYKYADLADVTAAVGPLLARYGLAFHCAPMIDPADRRLMILSWSLLHESGEEKTGEWPLGLVNQKPQSLGSAITYGRRYCLSAATGIVAEDDDDGQRSQQDHGSRQSAGDIFEQSAPARQNGNGQQRGQVSRPAQQQAAAPPPADVDEAAMADWAAKIDEIASAADADRFDGELREVFKSGHMNPTTANAIRKAIRAKRDTVARREMAGAQ